MRDTRHTHSIKTLTKTTVAVFCFTALLLTAVSAEAAVRNGRIAFEAQTVGGGQNSDIFTLSLGGGAPQNLTNSAGFSDTGASYSPDGNKIAFTSNRDGDDEIYTMNPDGSGVTKLTNNNYDDFDPNWVNANTVVFVSWATFGNGVSFRQIYTVNGDGSNLVRQINERGDAQSPSVSADGSKIVYFFYAEAAQGENPPPNVYMVSRVSAGQPRAAAQLTEGNGVDTSPSFLAGSNTEIIFSSARNSRTNIWTMPVDRSRDPELLVHFDGSMMSAAASPDGTKIVFHGSPFGAAGFDLYVADIVSGEISQITDTDGLERNPSWQSKTVVNCPPICPQDIQFGRVDFNPITVLPFNGANLGGANPQAGAGAGGNAGGQQPPVGGQPDGDQGQGRDDQPGAEPGEFSVTLTRPVLQDGRVSRKLLRTSLSKGVKGEIANLREVRSVKYSLRYLRGSRCFTVGAAKKRAKCRGHYRGNVRLAASGDVYQFSLPKLKANAGRKLKVPTGQYRLRLVIKTSDGEKRKVSFNFRLRRR